MKSSGLCSVFLVLVLWVNPLMASELDEILPGHWVEVRGSLDESGIFRGQRIELMEPQGREVLIGNVSTTSKTGEFQLLGQTVQISRKTKYHKVVASELENKRVKVEGHYRSPRLFSARKVSARGPGRERISGPVSGVSHGDHGYTLLIMSHRVQIAKETALRHEKPLEEYAVVSLNPALPTGKHVSEEDQFGEGIRISNRIRFTTLVEARYKGEKNYDLYDPRKLDLRDTSGSIRGRFVLAPGEHGISGQFEYRYTRLRRHLDVLGSTDSDVDFVGESFVFLEDPFGVDFDIQAGRMDFDDRREWVYDQNLDGIRAYWTLGGWVAELSATTTLSHGKKTDEHTNNFIAYVADLDRRFAGYMIYRDMDFLNKREKVMHVGVRAFVQWPEKYESWLEIARMTGSRNSTDLGGWGFDIGTTRDMGRRFYLTAGWAFGQGDARTGDGNDGNFRQTGLQDNNGKFGGVTSFRYYGELMDPELANLHVGTLGLGYRFTRRGSIDLIGHYYRQNKAARRIINSDLDQKPRGLDPELGWEVDAVIGWRPVRAWDFEIDIAWFKPGKAFLRRDDAWMTKLQVRYRY